MSSFVRRALYILAALILCAAGASAQTRLVFRPKIDFHTLHNGLSVCFVELDTPGVVAYWTVVQAGSRNEIEPGRTGYAHLFEHLMFRGTKDYPRERFNEAMSLMGADHNAFTDTDRTVYTATIPSGELQRMIEIQADRFQNLTYTEEDHIQETGAVLGEFNIGRADPATVLHEKLYETAFTTHTYGHSVIGREEDVRAMPDGYDYGLEFFDLHYRPNNCCIFVVGDFAPSSTLSLILKHYQRWEEGPEPPGPPEEPPQTEPRRAEVTWPGPTSPRVVVGFHVPGFGQWIVDDPVLQIANEVAFGKTSPFYRRWVEETRRALEVVAKVQRTVDPGLYAVEIVLKDEADIDSVRADILGTAARLAEQPPSEKAIDRAREHLTNSFLTKLETPEDVAWALGELYSLTGHPRNIHAYFSRLQEVKPESVRDLAGDILVESNSTTVTLVSRVEGSQ